MSQAASIVLFTFLGILLSIFSTRIHRRIKVPLPTILLLIGLLLRLASPYVGLLSVSHLIDVTSSKALILVLIPPSVYQSSSRTDWNYFKKDITQILPLGTSVIFVSMLLQAFVIKYILQLTFTWNESILIGAVLCTTDFSTSKFLMKKLHIDVNISTVISGEAIINQASVFALFTILNETPSAVAEIGYSILLFIRYIGIGILIAIGFSYVLGRALRRIVNDFIQETNLTLATAFLLMFVNNALTDSSGVISVVTFGLYMSAYGKTLVSPTVQKEMDYFWELLSFASESIGFLIGGMTLGREFITSHILGYHDIYRLLISYCVQLIIRFIVIISHYLIISKCDLRTTLIKATVITLSGVKGVMSTLLAIVVSNDLNSSHTSNNPKLRSYVLFLTIGITFLSMLFNPILLKFIQVKLKFKNLTDMQENLLLRVTSQIMQKTYKKLEKLEKSKEFPLVKWNEVFELAGPKELVIAIMKRSGTGKNILKLHPNDTSEMLISRFCEYCDVNDIFLEKEIRRRFYKSLERIYWQEFEKGQCLGQTALVLMNSTTNLQQKDSEELQDWKMIEPAIFNYALISKFRQFFEKPLINNFFRSMSYNRIIKAYDAASTFLKAHKRARDLFENMEIDAFVLNQVLKESLYQEKLCEDFLLQNIIDNYPEIISEVQSKMASYTLLISQRKLINKIYHQGVIKSLEYNYLLTAIDANFKTLTFLSSPTIPRLRQILQNRFKKASNDEISELIQNAQELHLKPEQSLFKEGEIVNGVYLILTGTVREYSDWINQTLTIGNIVGVQHLLPGMDSHYNSSAKTLTVVTSVLLPKNMLEYECFEEDIYKDAAEEFLILNKEKFNIKQANNDHIIFLVGMCYIKRAYQGSLISLKRGAFVVKGRIRTDKGCFSLIRPTRKKIESIDNALLLMFPANFSKIIRRNRNIPDAMAEFYIKNSRSTEFKQFYILKQEHNRRETSKKLSQHLKSRYSMDSFDKMLDI